MTRASEILADFRACLIDEYACPQCLGRLSHEDEDYLVCRACGYDAAVEVLDDD